MKVVEHLQHWRSSDVVQVLADPFVYVNDKVAFEAERPTSTQLGSRHGECCRR
jgi:hypothetical protein